MAIKNYDTNVGSLKDHVFVSVIFMNLICQKNINGNIFYEQKIWRLKKMSCHDYI